MQPVRKALGPATSIYLSTRRRVESRAVCRTGRQSRIAISSKPSRSPTCRAGADLRPSCTRRSRNLGSRSDQSLTPYSTAASIRRSRLHMRPSPVDLPMTVSIGCRGLQLKRGRLPRSSGSRRCSPASAPRRNGDQVGGSAAGAAHRHARLLPRRLGAASDGDDTWPGAARLEKSDVALGISLRRCEHRAFRQRRRCADGVRSRRPQRSTGTQLVGTCPHVRPGSAMSEPAKGCSGCGAHSWWPVPKPSS